MPLPDHLSTRLNPFQEIQGLVYADNKQSESLKTKLTKINSKLLKVRENVRDEIKLSGHVSPTLDQLLKEEFAVLKILSDLLRLPGGYSKNNQSLNNARHELRVVRYKITQAVKNDQCLRSKIELKPKLHKLILQEEALCELQKHVKAEIDQLRKTEVVGYVQNKGEGLSRKILSMPDKLPSNANPKLTLTEPRTFFLLL